MGHILVIDDDIKILKILRLILEKEGYDVSTSCNGNEGMKLLRKQPVDLVITDIIMPDKEGLETIMELRRDFPCVKIVAMSGGGRLGQKEYLHVAKKLGAQRTVAKPFTRKDVLEAVSQLMGHALGHKIEEAVRLTLLPDKDRVDELPRE